MKIAALIVVISFIGLSTLIIFPINKQPKKHCIEWKIERYYDSSGTSLWVTTKNAGFLAMNGWKNREVCIKYELINTQ